MQISTFKPTCNGFVRDQHNTLSPRTPRVKDTRRLADEIPVDAIFHRLELLTELLVPFSLTIRNADLVQMYEASKDNLWFDKNGVTVHENELSCCILKTEIGSAWLIHNPADNGALYSLELYNINGDLFIQVFPESGPDLAVWNEILGSIPSLID